MELIYWTLASFGLSNIIVYGKIFQTQRDYITSRSNFFGSLINCIMCFSFWSGILLSLIYSPSNALLFNFNTSLPLILLSSFIDGLYSSGSVYLINTIIEKLERN